MEKTKKLSPLASSPLLIIKKQGREKSLVFCPVVYSFAVRKAKRVGGFGEGVSGAGTDGDTTRITRRDRMCQ